MRRSARLALAAAVAAVTGLGVVATVDVVRPRHAGAVESETYPLPAGGAWTVAGKGFGHGRGMSQWGSQGAALRGPERLADPRLLLPGHGDHDDRRRADPGAAQRRGHRHGGRAARPGWRSGTSRRRCSTRCRPGRALAGGARRGRDAPRVRQRHDLDAVDRAGRAEHLGRPAALRRRRAAVLTLYIGQAPAAYRGTLTAVPTGTSDGRDGEHGGMDLYLRSVVPAESPAYWQSAALRAQAVAARTYAAYGRARSTGAQLGHLRHHRLPGLPGHRERGGEHHEGGPGHRQPDPHAVRPADPGRVLRVERRLDGGRGAAVPGRQAGPVRRGRRREPERELDDPADRGGPARPLPAGRQPDRAAGRHPDRQRHLGWADHRHVGRRVRRLGAPDRRRRPASGCARPGGSRRRRSPARRWCRPARRSR